VNDRRLGVLEPSYKDGFTRGGSVTDVQRDAKGAHHGFRTRRWVRHAPPVHESVVNARL